MNAVEVPFLSVIVISQNNEATIERTLASIVAQRCPRPFEIILVDSGSDKTVEIVRRNFPEVIVLDLGSPVYPGKARNAGVGIARGDYVSFPGSHVELPPESLAARMKAHEKGYAMVTGAIINGTDSPAGWASYFMDHSASMPDRPSGLLSGPPHSCSYDRRVLIQSGLFPEDRRTGEDTVVNQRLWEEGHRAYRDNSIKLIHVTRCSTMGRLAHHHFARGRGWGRILAERGGSSRELFGYVGRRLARIDDDVGRWGSSLTDRYQQVKSLIRLGVISAWLGASTELLRQKAKRSRSADSDGSIVEAIGRGDNHTTRDAFVDPCVKENPLTTNIIDAIFNRFPTTCKVVSGYLSASDLNWKVNYHWDAMRHWLEHAKDDRAMTDEERGKLKELHQALMANPPTQTGHFEINKIGEPEDASSEEEIEQRCLALQKLKADLAAYASRQNFGRRNLPKKGVLEFALNPITMPKRSNHIHGWALDIAGDVTAAAAIAGSLGATRVYKERTHCHCEFKDGVKLPAKSELRRKRRW